MAPACTVQDWVFTQPQVCSPGTNHLDLTYAWSPTSTCRRGHPLPPTYPLQCPYVPFNSPFGFAITVLTGIGLMTSLVYMLMLAWYRRSNPIKMASFVFCEVILLGSVLMYMTSFFMTDIPVLWKCNISIWVLVIGFGMTFGGLFVKLMRIYKIFSNKGLKVIRVTDWFLFKNLLIIIGFEIAALLIWTLTNGGPQMVNTSIGMEPTQNITIYRDMCNFGSSGALVTLGAVNLVLIILAVGVAFATWSVPTQYNETKVIITSVFGVAFGCFVCVPLLFVVPSASVAMIVGPAIDIVLLFSMAVFCVPKLYESIRLENRRASRSSTKPGCCGWASAKAKSTQGSRSSKTKASKDSASGDMERHLSEISDSEEYNIRMNPTALAPAVRRNVRNASNSNNSDNDAQSAIRRFNLGLSSTPANQGFCPHCGLGIGDCGER
ncbi:7 transmembrane sweet-taste receptor of 3 GCPR-domain-containing protein [Jimgerdemannia flammicorona]|uniref:7 transmembrane sweet-taste receptor of 3 GCPR-domain-containing protein n=1 Tax=Jimgerdemannia flammicorona TaxID=994334 RepID=A0A433QK71_9FUNG|nr:7 transmembrane sweet-taste receptor of 3 GCPR-domain-containing protein [Jimgerdemannia flammicorona]